MRPATAHGTGSQSELLRTLIESKETHLERLKAQIANLRDGLAYARETHNDAVRGTIAYTMQAHVRVQRIVHNDLKALRAIASAATSTPAQA